MKTWRYYRDLSLIYITMILMVVATLRAFVQPVYWVATLVFLLIHNATRYAFAFTHPWRRFSLIQQDEADFKEITFKSRDGLNLFGRFLAGTNRSTILLAHGLGSSSRDLILLGRLLVRAGYGVFLIDLRAHGNSEGDTSTFGMRESDDVVSAVNYLLTRIDVHGDRIGAYGVSLGAQAVLRGALKTDKIRALVLEGLGPSILSDHGGAPKSLIRLINYPFNWLYYLIYQLMIGGKDQGVLQVIDKIAPRPIFFIASGDKDIYFNRLFHHAANDPKEIWELPKGLHGGALIHHPDEFMRRVIGFFDKSFDVNRAS